MIRRTALTFATLFALSTAAPALAGDHAPDPAHMRNRAEHVFDAVDATPQQRTQAWRLLEDAFEQMRGYREEGRALRERLTRALVANEIDRGEVRSVRADLVDLFDRATDRGFELLVGIAEVFTPAQRVQMRELREMHRGWGGRQEGGPGDTGRFDR
jgi:Spy/CpxP family protein refolding chaperone